ncbi:MAG: D-alanyl-D-alanine carboxypeptidase/D-alanyl-D-alanine-endopeptidase, partial [Planctomycetia bacterium]
MRQVLLPWIVALAALLPGTHPATAQTGSDALAARLAARLAEARIPEASVGVAVLALGEGGALVYGRNPTQVLSLASVSKVLTAATALDLLGPGHAFTTRVSARGTLAGGVLDGDLVVHGSGDPHLSERAAGGTPAAVLEALARKVAAAGVREVRGALVLDDGGFDREYVHPGWSAQDRQRTYGAPVAGLAFNDSCIEVMVGPSRRAGERCELGLPATAGAWAVENLTTTVDGSRNEAAGAWSTATRSLQVRGKVGRTAPTVRVELPVPDPLAWFGGAFQRCLDTAGVRVRGGMRPARDAADRSPGRVLAEHQTRLDEVLRVMNRRSQNFYAGQVFKACGAAWSGAGSWASGTQAVREMLRRRGVPAPETATLVDGSGLAVENQASAGTVALTLWKFERDLLRGPVLHDSLAAPGEEGTLDDRLVTRFT